MAITIRQTASSNSGSCTFGSSTLANSTIIACVGAAGGITAPSVTGVTLGGSAGNFGSLINKSLSNGFSASQDAEIWADPSCASGQTSVSATITGATASSIVAYEVLGLLVTTTASSLVDQSSSGSSTSASSWTSGTTGTTVNPVELLVGCVSAASTPTGPSSPWVNTEPASDSVDLMAGQQVVSATGTAVYNGTTVGPVIYAAVVVTLFPVPGAPNKVYALNQAVNRAAVW